MEPIRTSSIDPLILPKASVLKSETPDAPIDAAPPLNQDSATVGGGGISSMSLQHMQIAEEINRKLMKAARGDTDFDNCFLNTSPPPSAQPAAQPGEAPGEPSQGIQSRSGGDGGGDGGGGGDPLVFDLNSDGDTNATVDQHGIDVDGLKHTKWAEKGDGVLAMGDEPLDTEGGKYKDAYENLRDKAAQAGIDVSKGYLDKADLETLEAQGLTMLVSNGDGTNQSLKPTELGITQMSLGGKKVDQRDSEGNRITEQGSFVRDGKTELVNDMWFNEI